MTYLGSIRLLLLATVLLVFASPSVAVYIVEEAKLTASDDKPFGSSASISGNTAVLGASSDDDLGYRAGAAYVFRLNGTAWVEEAKLHASDGALLEFFGNSVAISGDTIVVGAFFDGDPGMFPWNPAIPDESGSAYVFRYDGSSWVEEAKLRASDGAAFDMFGTSVSVSGDTVVVGANGDDDNGAASGAAYVFRFDGAAWVEEAKLTASDDAAGDRFGSSVSVTGDMVAIGAFLDDDIAVDSGSAYVFRFDGAAWIEEAKLTASDGASWDDFGIPVSAYDDTVVVGARDDDDNGSESGSAYVFRFDGTDWAEEAKLTASDAAAVDNFGGTVSVSGDTVIVGASGDDDNGDRSGSAYVFQYAGSGWSEEAKFTASDVAKSDHFGHSASVSGDTIVIGGGSSVYVFHLEPDLVEIDIEPNSDANSINLMSRDFIPVAILGSDNFDVLDVDVATLTFGPVGAEGAAPAHIQGGHYQDVDHDGFTDLLSHYRTHETGIAVGHTRACVVGETLEGIPFDDCDKILVTSRHDPVFTPVIPDVLEIAKLTALDAAASDFLGNSVSVSGDTLVVGAYRDDGVGSNSGSANVFRYDGTSWVEEAKLTASDAAANDEFGYSVSVSGDTIVVGAHGNETDGLSLGSAYVFRFDGSDWVEEAKLTASDGEEHDRFGNSVSVFGNTAVIGARRDDGYSEFCAPYEDLPNVYCFDPSVQNFGSAYVFRYDGSGWVEEAKLTAFDSAADDEFGYSVSVSGDTAIVGARYDDDGGSRSGSAYVFRFDGSIWVAEAKLTASDDAAGDRFGYSVSVSGDTAIVGAVYDDFKGTQSGSAYVFRYDGSTWVEETRLTAHDGSAGDHFGYSVSVSGNTVVAGAPRQRQRQASDSGFAYVFRYDGSGWLEEAKLTPSDGAPADEFGISVSVSGDTVVVGARFDDDDGNGSGSAYVFNLEPEVVDIDIRPGNDFNPINLMGRGVIPVAILGSDTFDVLDVDVETLAFGATGTVGAAPAHNSGGQLADLNDDGFTDLLSHYRTQETGIIAGDTEACVAGRKLSGIPFEGCDAILVLAACGLGFELALLLPGLMWLRQKRRVR